MKRSLTLRSVSVVAALVVVTGASTVATNPRHFGRNSAPPAGIEAAGPTVRRSIKPFELTNPDSTAVLRLQLVSQLLLQFESLEESSLSNRSNELTMKVRRLRTVATLKLIDQRMSFRAHLSMAPNSLELMDLYFNWVARPDLHVRIGQCKTPFTRYRIQSFQRLTFVDWSVVTRYFGAERQMGVALHNGYENPPRWGYAVGVYTGVNARASHAIGLAQLYGEELSNLSDLSQPGRTPKFHPELVGHLAFNSDSMDVSSDSDPEGGRLRYAVSFSAAWDIEPQRRRDLLGRLAAEFLCKYGGFSFFAAAYTGFAELTYTDRTELALLGGLLQAAYRATSVVEFSARWAFVDVTNELGYDIERHHMRLGNRTEIMSGERELTVGCNLYLRDHSLKWQTDAGLHARCVCPDQPVDFVARSQFQIAL